MSIQLGSAAFSLPSSIIWPNRQEKVSGVFEKASQDENIDEKKNEVLICDRKKNYLEPLSGLLKEQAELIERALLERTFLCKDIYRIRTKVMKLCRDEDLSEEEKLAELGLLYFCLQTPRPIPVVSSYMKWVVDEIESNVKELKHIHKAADLGKYKNLLPSGTTSYLLHRFAEMIIPPRGKLNAGGYYAVKMMLNGRLARFLREESLSQILVVVDRLIHDEDFRLHFQEPLEVHEGIEELIKLDLHLPEESKLCMTHVHWELLITLFSIVSQQDLEGNCYAVAYYANAFSKQPEKMIQLLVDVLKSAKFVFEGVEIPVLTLLESSNNYRRDFECTLEKKSLVSLRGYQMLLELDKTTNKRQRNLSTPLTLNTLFKSEIKSTPQRAIDRFLSLKKNRMHTILLSIMQFTSLNSMKKIRENRRYTCSAKMELQDEIRDFILYPFKERLIFEDKNKRRVEELFFKNYMYVLNKCIFLVDGTNPNLDLEKEYSSFISESRKAQAKEGSLNSTHYVKRQLYFLDKSGAMIPIETVSFFLQLLEDCMSQMPQEAEKFKKMKKDLRAYFQEDQTKEFAAQLVACQNVDRLDCDWETYHSSDSFLLVQRGANTEPLLRYPWNRSIPTAYRKICIKSKDESNLFEQLCQTLGRTLFPNQEFTSEDTAHLPMLLAQTEEHVFNLYPSKFSDFFFNTASLLDSKLINRGQVVLNQPFSYLQKKRVIEKTLGTGINRNNRRFSKIFSKELSAKAFLNKALKKIKRKEHRHLIQNFENELHRIEQTDFLAKVENILALFDLTDPHLHKNDVIAYLEAKLDAPSLTATQWSFKLQKALLMSRKELYFPVFEIERAIFEIFNLPQSLYLGNLNWASCLSENPVYNYLMLKYIYSKDKIELCQRVDGLDRPLGKELHEGLLKSLEVFCYTNSEQFST